MKKPSEVLIALISLLLLCGCGKTTVVPVTNDIIDVSAEEPEYRKVSISSDCVEYSHLGEDITIKCTCNGKEIHDGDIIKPTTALQFYITITEKDSVPDVGTGSVYFTLSNTIQSRSTEIRVDEDGGTRYPDAYAIYRVTIRLEPIYE